jgi:hypothetical protein
MDFIGKLFPFLSLFRSDGNTLTAWWVLITFGIFLFYIIRFRNVTSNLRKRLQVHVREFSEDGIENDALFSVVWKDYRETFIDYNGSQKTDEFSYEYFNEKNLISTNTNLKLINTIPATLVGLGILGTFFGLTYGISNFQTSSADQIKESIEILLSGMGTAFVTSIWGMLLSIFFTFFEKIQINSLHNSLHSLCYNLDKRFRITKEDQRRMEKRRQNELLDEYFMSMDESGRRIKPANVFRDIYSESVKQSRALQTFSTDLANLIEAGFEKILNDPDRGVVHELQSMKEEIVTLGSKIQDPASEMTQSVIAGLETSMKSMIEDFKESMSGSTKSELQELTQILVKAGGSLNDFPSKLETMTTILNDKFIGLQEAVQRISRDSIQQSIESNRWISEQLIEVSANLKANVGDLQTGQESLLRRQNENLNVSENLLNAFNSSIEKLNKLSSEVGGTISSFEDIQREMNTASARIKEIAENATISSQTLKSAQSSFIEHQDRQMSHSSNIIAELQKSLSQAKDVHSEYAENFGTIEKGLKGIFQQIEHGLENYEKAVVSNIKNYLQEYTKALTETAQNLHSVVTSQDELLIELRDLLEKTIIRNR